MLNLNCTVVIGGNDVSSYVVSIERKHSMCESTAVGSLEVSFECPYDIDPYDTVVIHETGTKVFTGYVASVGKGRMPINYTVEFSDPTIRLQDYWTTQSYGSNGETAEYWIGFFCDLADVDYVFDVTYNKVVPDDVEWDYNSAMSIIQELIVIGGFYMYSDPDGLIHFGKKTIGSAPESISTGVNILHWNRNRSLDITRNRAIVFGKYPIVEEYSATVPELGTHEKTVVIASRYVEDSGYALELAVNMVQHFKNINDTKEVEVLPNPDFRIGQSLTAAESWSNYSESCLITSLSSRMDASGYVMTLTLDEFCPFIWGYFITTGEIIYAGTDGEGVWRSDNLGLSWYDVTGNIPSGVSHYVRGISASGTLVWAATQGGAYVTHGGGYSWENRTPTIPSGVALTDWTDVEIDPGNSSTVYVLMDDLTNQRVYLHKTEDQGLTWANTRVE